MEAIWIFLAFVCGLGAKLLRLPVVVGYLVAGFILAEFDVEQTDLLKHFADLGLSLLLFTVGLHLRAKSFFRTEVLGTTLLHLAILTGCFSLLLWMFTDHIFIKLACALGFSSTVVTVTAFEKRRELESFLGRLALGVLVTQDIVSVVLIAGDAGYELTSRAFLLLVIIPALYLIRWLLSHSRSRELLLLLGVGYAFLADDIFSYLGLSGHLGALIAGATLANHPESESISKELWSVKELLLLALFLSIGLYGLPSSSSLPLFLALMVFLPIKGLLFFLLFLIFRLRVRTAFVASLGLTAYSEFTLVVAYYLQQAGSLPAEFVSLIAVVTAVSFGVCSHFISLSNQLWNRWEPMLLRLQFVSHTVDQSPVSLSKANTLIIGMGVTGIAAYERAVERGYTPVGIDSDPVRVSEHLQEEKRVVQADCQDGSFWAEVDMSSVSSIILAIPTLEPKLAAIELIRSRGFKGHLLALARDSQGASALKETGIDVSVVPMIEAGYQLADRLQ